VNKTDKVNNSATNDYTATNIRDATGENIRVAVIAETGEIDDGHSENVENS
jgi:hypothetical protein